MSTAIRHTHRYDRLVSTADDGRTLWACSVDPHCIETVVVAAPTSTNAPTAVPA